MTDAPAVITAKPRLRWPLSLIVGAGLTAVVLATALLALIWTPYDVEAVDIAAKLTAPSAAHPFGTDHFGRDVLSMIMAGASVMRGVPSGADRRTDRPSRSGS